MVPLSLKRFYVSKLEYENTVWRPSSMKHIKTLEAVQKRQKYGMLTLITYADRLQSLNLSRLDLRRVRGELIQVFKFLNDYEKVNLVRSPLFHNTNARGVLKLTTELCSHNSRSSFLFTRVSKIWNALPSNLKIAKSINEFKNLLDEINLDHYI